MSAHPLALTAPRSAAHPVAVTACLAFAVAVVALMQTMAIPLLPVLPETFDTSIATASWVATSTLITGAAMNPIVGRMGDMYGKRRLLVACLGVAAVGCVVSATADSLAIVVLGRAIQGLGAGVIPLSYGIIRDELSARQLSRAVAAITAGGAAAGAGLGPVAMGVVLATAGWRATFWVTAALLVLALTLVAVATRRGIESRFPAPFDLPGAIVLAIALIVLLLGITNGSAWGWASLPVATLLLAATAMVGWWVRWERNREDPMVDLELNRRRPILLAHLGGVMVGSATFAQFIAAITVVTLPLDTGFGFGHSVAVAGLVQLPGAVVVALAVVVGTRLSSVWGAAALLRLSAAVLVIGFVLILLRHGSVLDVTLSVVVVSAGLGVGHCALPLMVLEHVGAGSTAAVNAVNALGRVVGSVLASALVTSVMATGVVAVRGVERPAEWTIGAAAVIGALPAVLFGLLSWRMPVSRGDP